MINKIQFTRFWQDQSGQFAIMFAVIIIPLLAGVGLAIDYAGAVQSSTRLRDSTDAAAFYAATEYRKNGKLPTNDQVMKFVSGNYNISSGENEPNILSITVLDGKVVLKTEVKRPLAIMSIFGRPDTLIGASSTINVGKDEDIEIALVLDTTASMGAESGTSSTDLDPKGTYFSGIIPNVIRIDALKFSAQRFVDTVFANDGGKGRTRVAVVPFADYVNVGTDKLGAPWLTVPSTPKGKICNDDTPVISSKNCRQEYYIQDGAKIPYTQCDNVYGKTVKICYDSGWWGCVGSRKEPLNLKDSSPTSKFTGLMNTWCAMPIQALSQDKAKTLSTISNLSTYGNTYIPEGVMWGMRVLSSTVPFTEVKAPVGLKKVRKIMVLMTDGDNQAAADLPKAPTHHSIYEGSPNYAAERLKTDTWTLNACNEAKKAEMEIFTISFGMDISAQAKTIVQSCATDAKHYFNADDAAALTSAFQAIAAKVGGIYLSN